MRTLILSVSTPNDVQDKIVAIKSLRALTGGGLKETKELVESVMPHNSVTVRISHAVLEPGFTQHVTALRSSGLTVRLTDPNSKVRAGIGEELRRLVTFATMSAQYDIAKAIVDVLETYCPEPAEGFEDGQVRKETEE